MRGETSREPGLARAAAAGGGEDGAAPIGGEGSKRMLAPSADDGEVRARRVGDLGGLELGDHPARSHARGGAAVGHRHYRFVEHGHFLDQVGVGIALRIGGIEPVDVGKQDHAARTRRLRHAGGEPIIVAEADFLGRHRVILVDHRHHAQREQPVEGGAGVQIAAAILEIIERDEHLGCGEAMRAEQLRPAVR